MSFSFAIRIFFVKIPVETRYKESHAGVTNYLIDWNLVCKILQFYLASSSIPLNIFSNQSIYKPKKKNKKIVYLTFLSNIILKLCKTGISHLYTHITNMPLTSGEEKNAPKKNRRNISRKRWVGNVMCLLRIHTPYDRLIILYFLFVLCSFISFILFI